MKELVMLRDRGGECNPCAAAMVPLAGHLWVLDKGRGGFKLDVDGLQAMAVMLHAPPQPLNGWAESSAPLPHVPSAELLPEIPAGMKLPEFQQDFSFHSFAEERVAVLELQNSAAA